MALAFVQQLTTAGVTTSSGTYTSAAFSGSITAGNTMIAVVTCDDNNANQVTGITDAKGNTWTRDVENILSVRYVSIWRAPITTGGASDTVTVSYAIASSSASAVAVQEFSNSSGALTLDIVKSNNATSATPTTGASSTTTHAAELVIAGCVMTSTEASFTGAGAGYTNAVSKIVTNVNLAMESAVVAATGAQTATFTWPTSRAYAASLATYYEAGAPPATPTNLFFQAL